MKLETLFRLLSEAASGPVALEFSSAGWRLNLPKRSYANEEPLVLELARMAGAREACPPLDRLFLAVGLALGCLTAQPASNRYRPRDESETEFRNALYSLNHA